MVAHAVYVDVSLLAGTAEDSLWSIVAIVSYVAVRRCTEGAAGSSGRSAAVGVAEATAYRVVVSITRRGTVAVAVVVAVAIVVPIIVVVAVVAPVPIVVVIVIVIAIVTVVRIIIFVLIL